MEAPKPQLQPDAQTLMKQLITEGYTDVRICPIYFGTDAPEHTHDQHTVHIILTGELTVIDNQGTHTYTTGQRIEFPPGTTHKAFCKTGPGSMIVGIR